MYEKNQTPRKPQIVVSDVGSKKDTPKRFVTGGLTAASPPVGWLVNQQVLSRSFGDAHSFGGRSQGHSFGGRSQGHSFGGRSQGRSMGKSMDARFGKSVDHKEFQPFEHPSYELLKENGFVQQKYSKYHDRAIKGIFV